MRITNATARQLLSTAVRTNPVSVRIHQQAAIALQRAIDCKQLAKPAEAPDLAQLPSAAVEEARSRPGVRAFGINHQGLRYRVTVTTKGRVEVSTWRRFPLTVGLEQ